MNEMQITFLSHTFSDAPCMTALEKSRAVRNFEEILEKKDISLLKRELYEHLHSRNLFKYHGNLAGFKKAYEGIEGLRELVRYLKLVSPIVKKSKDYKDYQDIYLNLLKTATKYEKSIEEGIQEDELKLLQILAKKHKARVKFTNA